MTNHIIHIDLDLARRLLQQAMETQGPDFVYAPDGPVGCMNVPDINVDSHHPRAKTGCLVGTALSLAGIPMWHYPHGSASGVSRRLRADRIADIDLAAANYFSRAQFCQDHGASWGEAVEQAEATVRGNN